MTTEAKVIPSESQHWYYPDGRPCYEIPCKSRDGMRPTTIKDARKLGLVPSFTLIASQASKPGLEAWKLNQMVYAALTLPRIKDESDDAFAKRVITDSQEQGRKAMNRGKELHEAIEDYTRGKCPMEWMDHCDKIWEALLPFGINIGGGDGSAEHSFASELGYGGKIDWHHDSGVMIDFKTKDRIDDSKTLVWDEHPMQCAAYGYGVFRPKFRGLNVFVGVDDKQVRVIEHEWKDIERGWEMFKCLLKYWQLKTGFQP